MTSNTDNLVKQEFVQNIIIEKNTSNAFGIASFIFGIISIFFLSPIFVPLSLLFGIIAIISKQLAWGIIGIICAIMGFITSPILLSLFGLMTIASSIENNSIKTTQHNNQTIENSQIYEKTGYSDNNQKNIYLIPKKTTPVEGFDRNDVKENNVSEVADLTENKKSIEEGLINALRIKKSTGKRLGDSGKAIQAYMKQGIVNKKPNASVDYTDYYLINKPTSFMGHELLVIEEEYMTQYIGCCVNPGVGVSLKIVGGTKNLEDFAQKNGCSLTKQFDLKKELSNLEMEAKFDEGEFASLSCRERDINF